MGQNWYEPGVDDPLLLPQSPAPLGPGEGMAPAASAEPAAAVAAALAANMLASSWAFTMFFL